MGQTYPYLCHVVHVRQKRGVVYDAYFWLYLMNQMKHYYGWYMERLKANEWEECDIGKFRGTYNPELFLHLVFNSEKKSKVPIVAEVYFQSFDLVVLDVVQLPFTVQDTVDFEQFLEQNIKACQLKEKTCANSSIPIKTFF